MRERHMRLLVPIWKQIHHPRSACGRHADCLKLETQAHRNETRSFKILQGERLGQSEVSSWNRGHSRQEVWLNRTLAASVYRPTTQAIQLARCETCNYSSIIRHMSHTRRLPND